MPPKYRFFLLSVFSLLFSLPAFISAAQIQVTTYDQLLSAIRETRHAAEARIEAAVEQEKVREAWETGKLIHEHILLNKDRAEYGKQVLGRLAGDLGTSERELNYMVEFAREYPIAPTSAQLSWGHYRDLLAINDIDARNEIEKEATNQKWGMDELRRQIKNRKVLSSPNASIGDPEQLPEIQPGKTGIYRISKNLAGALYIDLGFSNYLELNKKWKFKEGDIVELQKGKLKKSEDDTLSYTYTGQVLEVLDGDTLKVEVSLGFGFTTVQKLRLRGIDAPELVSAEGKQAKAFLEKLLSPVIGHSSLVTIRTLKSDKYDRYLVDVWARQKYINQEMLRKNLAVMAND